MKKVHYRLIVVVITFLLFDLLSYQYPRVVLANGPKPAHCFDFYVTGDYEEAVYLDLLIRMDEEADNYVDFNMN